MFFINKDERNKWIDEMELKCHNTMFSAKTLGILLRSFHVGTPINFLILTIFAPQFIVNIVILLLFSIILMFYVFDGCFLSMIEIKLCKDDFTIADPILEVLNRELTKQNRHKITLTIMLIYMSIIFLIYYIRFLHVF